MCTGVLMCAHRLEIIKNTWAPQKPHILRRCTDATNSRQPVAVATTVSVMTLCCERRLMYCSCTSVFCVCAVIIFHAIASLLQVDGIDAVEFVMCLESKTYRSVRHARPTPLINLWSVDVNYSILLHHLSLCFLLQTDQQLATRERMRAQASSSSRHSRRAGVWIRLNVKEESPLLWHQAATVEPIICDRSQRVIYEEWPRQKRHRNRQTQGKYWLCAVNMQPVKIIFHVRVVST